MTIGWNDNAPIYRQLKEKVIGMMLDGALKAGDPRRRGRHLLHGSGAPAQGPQGQAPPPPGARHALFLFRTAGLIP